MNEKFIFTTPVSENQPFRLDLAGTTLCDPGYRITRNCSPYFVLEAVQDGYGKLQVNGVEYLVEPGDCYLLPIHARHYYASDPDAPWVKYWFNFSGTLVPELLRSYHLHNVVLFKGMFMAEQFAGALRRLEQVDMNNRQSVFAGVITGLIAEISARYHAADGSSALISHEGEMLRDMLEKHIAAPSPSLAQLAKKIGRSEAQMLRIFRRDFGTSPIAFLLERKLEQAMVLLLNTELTVKEIAAGLGFSDEFYFSRMFRKKCGKSPREYRRNDR